MLVSFQATKKPPRFVLSGFQLRFVLVNGPVLAVRAHRIGAEDHHFLGLVIIQEEGGMPAEGAFAEMCVNN
jgi:hypothetical protein